jgi:hypothetical protein
VLSKKTQGKEDLCRMPTKNISQKIVLTDTRQRVTAVKVAVKWSRVACLCRVSNFDTGGQRQSLPSVKFWHFVECIFFFAWCIFCL